MGFKYDLNRLIYPMINDFNAFYRMIYDLKCENCVKEVMYKMDLLENMDRDVAILNSLANYTYTHQLLKCKAQNDLSFRLIRYIPLQDLNLRFDIMNIKFYLLSQEMDR